MIKIFEEGSWNQKKLEAAINKCGVEKVLEDLCNYICEDELSDFLGYFCDEEDCWPKDED